MPTPLINFADAVNADALNPNAAYAVYYADGNTANEGAVRARCPHAKLFGITTRGSTGPGIFACDSEAGDLDWSETLAWVEKQIVLDVKLITVYADLDRWVNEGLLSALEHYGSRIKRWVADWNGDPNSRPAWADADQYLSEANVDLDVAVASFFGAATPAPTVRYASAEVQVSIPEGTTGVLRAELTFDSGNGHWALLEQNGDVKFSGPGGGRWRHASLEFNAPPLGK